MQPEKQAPSISVTLLGIVIDVSPVQSEKQLYPIRMTLLGMETEVRLVQPEKSLYPKEVTVLPMVTSDSLDALLKGDEPDKILPIYAFCRAVSSNVLTSMASVVASPSSKTAEVRAEQPLKAYSLMEVTLLGIVTEVNPVQPWKLLLPISVRLLESLTEDSSVAL